MKSLGVWLDINIAKLIREIFSELHDRVKYKKQIKEEKCPKVNFLGTKKPLSRLKPDGASGFKSFSSCRGFF